MKRIAALVMVAATGAVLGIVTGAGAAGTANVDVTATVVGTCKLASDGALTFSLDPSLPGPFNPTAVTAPTFWCTKGATVTSLTADDGLYFDGTDRNMRGPGAGVETIKYSFSFTDPVGTGSGGPSTPVAIPITGQVVLASFQSVSAGAYADTIVLTIAP